MSEGPGNAMADRLRVLAEPLVVLSLAHLAPDTRRKLLQDELSVQAYPHPYGGFVHVGRPPYRPPDEADLAAVFEVAALAGIAWLQFDLETDPLCGLPVFEP